VSKSFPVPVKDLEKQIYLVRNHKVMLDTDLAFLYGVETRTLIQAIKRNKKRFPEDFMFQLTKEEMENLRSQFVISSHGGRRYLPHAFTEQGVAMLSGVLNSERAILVNIQIMRTFTKIRQMILSHQDLTRKIEAMERKYDQQFKVVFNAIKQLLSPSKQKPLKIKGFIK